MFKNFIKIGKTIAVILGVILFSSNLFAGNALSGKIDGFYIESYKGNSFEKIDMGGIIMYIAQDLSGSNISVAIDPVSISMDEYLDINLELIKAMGFTARVISKDENTAVVSSTMGPISQKIRSFRDVKNKRIITVTGTYMNNSGKFAVIECVDSARLIEE